MKISNTTREKLDKLKDGPPLIVGIGPVLDSQVIKREVIRGSHAGGNHPLPTAVYNEALTGFQVRLYTHRERQRDGVWILTKIEHIRVFQRKRVPTVKGDKKIKTMAREFGKQIAREYGWLYVEDAKHNQEVPDLYQAYVELGEVCDAAST